LGDNILSEISKPGIDEFSGEKIYLDTSCVNDTNIDDLSYKITFNDRPSRANMKPEPYTIWFAKMKDSKKLLLIDTYSKFIINNIILSTGFSCLKTKPESLYYLWNLFYLILLISKKYLATGTTMQGINNDNIKKIKILIPTNEILLKFNDLVKPIYEKIYKNDLEIQSLSQIRDSLLPKLMSGKIRVV
jgi:type I restriction enzyme S subunit